MKKGSGLRGCWLLLAVGALAALWLPASAKEEAADPLPLRRVLLSRARLRVQLERLREGVLVRLPRADFEARVRRAANVARIPPRLVEARYRAALADLALTGTAQWKVHHAGPVPALLDLQPGGQAFSLALKQPRWENREALLAEFDGRSLSLLVDQAGEHSVTVEWSARTEERPQGLHVDLRIPPAPVAVLELALPADRAIVSLDGAPVSGPHPSESPSRKVWKIVASRRGQVRLLIRRGGGDGTAAVILARARTTQTLQRDGLEAVYSFALDVLHQGVSELACWCDPLLRPTEVQVPGLDSWEVRAGARPGLPSTLVVKLSRPLREGTLRVRCLAPLGPAGPEGAQVRTRTSPRRAIGNGQRADRTILWHSPGLHVNGAVPLGEVLELRFHPDLRLRTWKPGSFRLTGTGEVPAPRPGVPLRRLTLVGGGLRPAGSAGGNTNGRPSAELRAGGAHYRARQMAWWQVRPDGMDLTLQIDYQVEHGQLFQLPVRLPVGWEIEGVEVRPADLLRNWAVDRERSLLRVDLRRPLRAGGEMRPALTVRLRPARAEALAGRNLAFPDAVPLGARFREGALAIDFDPQVSEVALRTQAVRAEPDGAGPWKEHIPEHYYPYRGEPVQGSLRLSPRPPRLRARCASEVFVASGRAAVETHLLLEAEVGAPERVDLYLSVGAGKQGWDWRREDGVAGNPGIRVRRAERLYGAEVAVGLAALGARDALSVAALLAGRPLGQRWRLTLERPLRSGEVLALHATHQLEPAGGGAAPRWQVPLPAVLGAAPMEGEVTLHLAGADLVQVEAYGLREGPARPWGARARVRATPWRTFRYGEAGAGLTLRGQALAAGGPPSRTVVQRAELTTTILADGSLRHHFGFRVASHPQRTLMLGWPRGARPVAVAIDGRWLERLPGLVRYDADNEDLPLPVPARLSRVGDSAHYFEVLYTTSAQGRRWPWRRLEAPAPKLPVEPLAFRRRWRLPPGMQPLSSAGYRRLVGSGEGASASPRQPADLFRISPLLPRPWSGPDGRGQRQQALADAAAGLRSRPGSSPLRAVVEEVAFGYLKERHPLIVDARAVREAGLGPDTPVRIEAPTSVEDRGLPWEEHGLVSLAARSGVLLTSRRQAEEWRAGGEELSEDLESALAAAVASGQDPSGRFLTALRWLCSPPAASPQGGALLDLAGAEPGWTEWEPVAGMHEGAVLLAVDRALVRAGGLVLMIGLVLLLGSLRRRSGLPRLALLLLWLALTGTAVLWLPAALQELAWWPLLGGLAVALVWYLRWAARGAGKVGSADSARASRRLRLAGGMAVAGALAGLLALGVRTGRGATPAPMLVYLVPAETLSRQTVLVPPALLRRLEQMARPKFSPAPGAVLVSAQYEGKLVKGLAEFDAVFQVHVLGDGPATLAVPLDGVLLRGDVLLDGARAHPVARPAPLAGIALTVRGAGKHKVELKFRVRASSSGEERVLRFTVPRLVQSRLGLRLPAGARYPQALVKHGAQRLTGDPKAGQRLEADLGAVSTPIHLRWFEGATPARPARVEFREAYLWDLYVDASSLTALLHYRVRGGVITSLAVDLPPELEVRSAEARRPSVVGPPGAGARTHLSPLRGGRTGAVGNSVRLRNWRVTGSGTNRTLHLDFPGPVAGAIEIVLDLVPRGPLADKVTLPLPRPQGKPLAEVSHLAYRTNGVEAHRTDWLGVSAVSNAAFAPFWPARGRPAAATLAYAVTFRREPKQLPKLLLRLRPQPVQAEARQTVALRVGVRQAQVRATLELTARDKDLSVVEWEVRSRRPLTVAGVSGPDVYSWSQTGSRLLVWLRRTTGRTRLELSGWLPLEVGPAKRPGAPPGPARLQLPCLRVPSAQRQQTTVRLVAEPGLALSPQKVRNLTAAGGPAPEQEGVYTTKRTDYAHSDYAGEYAVLRGAGPKVRILTRAEVRERQVRFTAALELRPGRGGLRQLRLRLRHWDGESVRLEAPAGTVARQRQVRRGRARTWTLDLKSGVTGPYVVRLVGGMGVDEASGGVVLPDVSVEGSAQVERVVALGKGLSAEGVSGLVTLANPTAALARWPRGAVRAVRGSRVWKVAAADWRLAVLPRDAGARSAPVDVLLAEQEAAVQDGARWLHQAVYWLRHEAHTDLNVRWGVLAPVRVVSVVVDGVETSPLQPEPNRLWLPLPGQAGVRRVQLRWVVEGEQWVDRPNLRPPAVVGARGGRTLWTVHVPAGWQLREAGAGATLEAPDRVAVRELARAGVQLEISRGLAGRMSEAGNVGRLTAAQRRFYLGCRRASQALEAGAGRATDLGPRGQGLGAWLEELRQQNRELAQHGGFEPVRKEAERLVKEGVVSAEARGADEPILAEQGTPFSWQTGPGEAEPVVRLVPEGDRQTRRALVVSAQWLALLGLVWLVSLSPHLRGLARWLWPEQLILVGLLGWHLAGPTALALFLVALGVCGRVLVVGNWLRGWLRPAAGGAPALGSTATRT
jgi:hypothetical protein